MLVAVRYPPTIIANEAKLGFLFLEIFRIQNILEFSFVYQCLAANHTGVFRISFDIRLNLLKNPSTPASQRQRDEAPTPTIEPCMSFRVKDKKIDLIPVL